MAIKLALREIKIKKYNDNDEKKIVQILTENFRFKYYTHVFRDEELHFYIDSTDNKLDVRTKITGLLKNIKIGEIDVTESSRTQDNSFFVTVDRQVDQIQVQPYTSIVKVKINREEFLERLLNICPAKKLVICPMMQVDKVLIHSSVSGNEFGEYHLQDAFNEGVHIKFENRDEWLEFDHKIRRILNEFISLEWDRFVQATIEKYYIDKEPDKALPALRQQEIQKEVEVAKERAATQQSKKGSYSFRLK